MGDRKENSEKEIEQFKASISLADYAASIGYQKDANESSRNSWVMRRAEDKIVVATATNGHGIYFSVRDDDDNGTIIDFVQRRLHQNLGEVRKHLRQFSGHSFSYCPKTKPRKPEPSDKDLQQVIATYSKTRPAPNHHYLVNCRKISPEILADPRFLNVVRTDARQNAIFPHYDRAGLAGFEIKNREFTGFSGGGTKSLWYSRNLANSDLVIIVESAIDGLSHAQMEGGAAAYASIAGAMSDHQRDLLQGLITKANARGAKVLVGTDNDTQGEDYAQEIIGMGATGRIRPEFKDWNDCLCRSYV